MFPRRKDNKLKFAKSICSLLIASFAVAAAFAQQAAPAPTRTIVRAGKLLDVRTGKTLTNQTIIIEDGKIVSVGPDPGANGDANVIDLSGKTVLPGLIDAHTHIYLRSQVRLRLAGHFVAA